MQIPSLLAAMFVTTIAVTNGSTGSPLDGFRWKNRLLGNSAPAGDGAAEEQRRIYQAAVKGMSERQIVLAEALDGSERSRGIRSKVLADGSRFQVFLVGKDGHTAFSSDKPVSANDLFARVDAMPMRQDEIRRAR